LTVTRGTGGGSAVVAVTTNNPIVIQTMVVRMEKAY
jgi:hypothetical protein